MRRLVFLILLITANSGSAQPHTAWVPGPTSDILTSILYTIYEGQSPATEIALSDLSSSYQRFLNEFIHEPFCDEERLLGLETACRAFQEKERLRIAAGAWSASYAFHKAEFSQRMSSYNFVRRIPLVDGFLCQINLLVTFDLRTKKLIHKEHWARCK